MSYIIDKFILIILSVMMLIRLDNGLYVVIIILISTALGALNYYLDNKTAAMCISLGYAFLCMLYPSFAYMVPVIIYDAFGYRLIVSGVVLFIASFGPITDAGINAVIFYILISAIACILNYKTKKNYELGKKVNQIRDDSQERNLYLAAKNRALIEKQDNEVYVATLKERNRIAREIHDNVGHMLTRSILQMGALITINKDEPLHGQLLAVKDTLDTAMNNIRESVHDLHDEAIDLNQALSDIIEPLNEGFEVKYDYDVERELPREYKYTIIGIVKEAVSNVIKHSRNDTVEIDIRQHPGMYQIIVHDYNANGDNSRPVRIYEHGSGIGLHNMKDRVDSLKGNISINTEEGFRVFVTLPRV